MQGRVDLFDYLLVNHSGFLASSFAGKNIFYATDSKKEIEDAKSKEIGREKGGEAESEREMKIERRYGNGCLFAKQWSLLKRYSTKENDENVGGTFVLPQQMRREDGRRENVRDRSVRFSKRDRRIVKEAHRSWESTLIIVAITIIILRRALEPASLALSLFIYILYISIKK